MKSAALSKPSVPIPRPSIESSARKDTSDLIRAADEDGSARNDANRCQTGQPRHDNDERDSGTSRSGVACRYKSVGHGRLHLDECVRVRTVPPLYRNSLPMRKHLQNGGLSRFLWQDATKMGRLPLPARSDLPRLPLKFHSLLPERFSGNRPGSPCCPGLRGAASSAVGRRQSGRRPTLQCSTRPDAVGNNRW